jgi:hypothetical protein
MKRASEYQCIIGAQTVNLSEVFFDKNAAKKQNAAETPPMITPDCALS